MGEHEFKWGYAVSLCANLCETAPLSASVEHLEALMARTCVQAGFPRCERVYVGSYFCENYFCGLPDSFHRAVRELCMRYGLGATLVVPLFGQAFVKAGLARMADLLAQFGGVYDEVVVNDAATFADVASQARRGTRIGLGRLFSKGMRDARYPELFEREGAPRLSAEAAACLGLQASLSPAASPLVEVDPTNAVVNVSDLLADMAAARAGDLAASEAGLEPAPEPAPGRLPIPAFGATSDPERVSISIPGPTFASDAAPALAPEPAPEPAPEVAIHLPLCYATTGRNCAAASIGRPVPDKFHLGRECAYECLRLAQTSRTEEGVRYVKHGRTHYFENPACRIAGTQTWRVVYAAPRELEGAVQPHDDPEPGWDAQPHDGFAPRPDDQPYGASAPGSGYQPFGKLASCRDAQSYGVSASGWDAQAYDAPARQWEAQPYAAPAPGWAAQPDGGSEPGWDARLYDAPTSGWEVQPDVSPARQWEARPHFVCSPYWDVRPSDGAAPDETARPFGR